MLLINAEMLNEIDNEFEKAVKGNKRIRSLYKKIRDGTATFEDASTFAVELGKDLSAAFGKKITIEELPNGRMTYSIANEVVRPEIVKGYDYTASYFNTVQKNFYKKNKLNIKGASPDLNEDRIDGFVEKLTSDNYENVSWILEDAGYLQNYLESVVDTGIKNNVGMLGESGIRAKIVRTVDGNACPWCVNLAGEYDYPVVDDEVYRRHRDCHCKVTYTVPNGFRQNVWSKETWQESDEAENRKKFQITKTKLSPQGARRLERALLNQ